MWWKIDPDEIRDPRHHLVAGKVLRALHERVVARTDGDVPEYRYFTVPSWTEVDEDYLVVLRVRYDEPTPNGRRYWWEASCPCQSFVHCWHGYAAAAFHAETLGVDVPQPPAPIPARPRGARPPTRRRPTPLTVVGRSA